MTFDGQAAIADEADGSGYLAPVTATGRSSSEDADLLLDLVHASLLDGHDPAAMANLLNSGLKMLRSYMPAAGWTEFCARAQQHSLVGLLMQDPFFARANTKPRGYAGDAVMIDLLYGTGDCEQSLAATTPFGRRMFAVTSRCCAADGIRERREILARLIDSIADAHAAPIIFAVAAGHLREAELSCAYAADRVGRWVALDQDAESIAEIHASLGDRIETVTSSIGAILKDEYRLENADLVYAAGLYDYLPVGIAIKLTRRLGAMLRPGGRLLFANFAADLWDSGFMEAVMDWKLILRTPAEMRGIAAAIGQGFDTRQWSGVHGAIHYCEVTRR